jgi:hypothetical protein
LSLPTLIFKSVPSLKIAIPSPVAPDSNKTCFAEEAVEEVVILKKKVSGTALL